MMRLLLGIFFLYFARGGALQYVSDGYVPTIVWDSRKNQAAIGSEPGLWKMGVIRYKTC